MIELTDLVTCRIPRTGFRAAAKGAGSSSKTRESANIRAGRFTRCQVLLRGTVALEGGGNLVPDESTPRC